MLKATTTTTKNTNINTNKNNKRKTNISKNTDTYTSAKNTTNNQATHGIFLLLLLCNCFHLNDGGQVIYYIYIVHIYVQGSNHLLLFNLFTFCFTRSVLFKFRRYFVISAHFLFKFKTHSFTSPLRTGTLVDFLQLSFNFTSV